MKTGLVRLFWVFLWVGNPLYGQNQEWKDHVFDPNIKTILFHPVNTQSINVLEYPIVYLNKPDFLQLEFDEIGDQYKNYNFKLIHCNHDWKQSILNDFEFLDDFNEFSIDEYELSLNTRTPYVHYSLKIPKTKVSGNYVVKVYRNMNTSEVAFTRRFVVFDSRVNVELEPKFPLDPAYRFSDQQIDFVIRYGDFPMFNPREMVKVVVRQNGRWDNAIYNLQPLFLKDQERILDYHFYNNENIFPGLNEYRGFDIRSIRFRGQNLANTNFNNEKAEAYVMPEQSRNKKNMGQWIDLNGRFVIENFETRRGHVEADYVDTYFTLDLDADPDGDVYLFGLMTDWEIRPEFQMTKVEGKMTWKGHAKLKQGFYNYSYAVAKQGMRPNESLLEGSYNLAENIYDVLVYFRPIGGRYDQVIGYSKVDYNKMR